MATSLTYYARTLTMGGSRFACQRLVRPRYGQDAVREVQRKPSILEQSAGSEQRLEPSRQWAYTPFPTSEFLARGGGTTQILDADLITRLWTERRVK